MNNNLTLIATATMGLEMIVKREVQALGFDDIHVSNGKVAFKTTTSHIPTANLWLRAADRVLLKMGEFTAVTFDQLFDQTNALPWEEWITEDGKFIVIGKSVKSQLKSVRTAQAIVKKAIVERLKKKYQIDWFTETGPAFTIQVAIRNDHVLLTIDTSGTGLHKRGYRQQTVEAPLKETLAAGLVQLSFWHKERRLLDPLCGSGTIPIEAALLARNIAPGLNRTFASEAWPSITQQAWADARAQAQNAIQPSGNLQILGYDIDPTAIEASQRNAQHAHVADDIIFTQQDIKSLWIDRQYGILITNLPYGMRVSDFQALNQIYISLNKTFRKKSGWSLYVLTADKKFPNYFKRARPNRVRKLYNGAIEVNYYQYYGDKPSQ